MLQYLFLTLFCAFGIVHLIDSWRDDAKRRARTKPFLLLLLALYYVFAADRLSPFLLGALLSSWLGDVLLIKKGHGWFAAGGVSFGIAHLLFIAVYLPSIRFEQVPWLIVIPAALVYYGISLKIILALRPTTPKSMVGPMYLYLLANSTMNVFALMQLFTLGGTGALIAYLGAVLFFISDCSLFLVRYYKNPDLIFKRHFTVMLTYLAGEFLITLGMILVMGS